VSDHGQDVLAEAGCLPSAWQLPLADSCGIFLSPATNQQQEFRSSSRNVQSTVIDLGLAWLTTYLIPAKRLEVSCVLFLS
jgi:hypothetical protein